jgi:hypothetical protein
MPAAPSKEPSLVLLLLLLLLDLRLTALLNPLLSLLLLVLVAPLLHLEVVKSPSCCSSHAPQEALQDYPPCC